MKKAGPYSWLTVRSWFTVPARLAVLTTLSLLVAGSGRAQAEDWAARSEKASIPLKWDSKTNMKWSRELPGPGSSSPIVYGDHVFVTCYTGYGDGSEGRASDLMRHLICINKNDGKIVWKKSVDAKSVRTEDRYSGYIKEHGYASSTPATDGKAIYAFFGKVGAVAFDMKGNELWRRNLGTSSSNRRWGSAASPILFKDTVIVNAVEESEKIFALNKKDGSIKWEYDTRKELAYSTPNLVQTKEGKTELVLGVPTRLIGLDPESGKELWTARTPILNNVSPAVMVQDDIVFLYGGYRGSGSIAVRAGGKGDVSKSHVVWASRDTNYVSTPVLHKGHIYWIDKNGVATCVNAKNGERIYKTRVEGLASGGQKFYASMVTMGDHVFAVSRQSGTIVLDAKPEYSKVGQNVIEGDQTDFNATPAFSGNQMFIRSNKAIYCISKD